MNNLQSSWERLWAGIDASGDGTRMRDELIARYSEPWRKYHTLQHLQECICTFESVRRLAIHPEEIEAALWFHDAVYELRANDNEERSARLAEAVLATAGISPEAVARVVALVLATRHTAAPALADEQLLVDIDLSILGAAGPRFAEYERQIRDEYAFVPEPVFREKRRAILQSFVKRRQIFGTPHFHGLLEAQARCNLERAISGTLG